MDDICIGCKNEAIAKSITEQIGEKVKFAHEETLPITFMGVAKDYNGIEIEQYSDSICVSAQSYIERLLKTHNWTTPSSKEATAEESKKPIAPLSPDCLGPMYNEQGPREGTVEHSVLEKKHGFSYRTLLGELMYAYITARPDIGYAITTLSKFSSSPADVHYPYIKGVAKYLR